MKNSFATELARIHPDPSRLKIAFGGWDLEITDEHNRELNSIHKNNCSRKYSYLAGRPD